MYCKQQQYGVGVNIPSDMKLRYVLCLVRTSLPDMYYAYVDFQCVSTVVFSKRSKNNKVEIRRFIAVRQLRYGQSDRVLNLQFIIAHYVRRNTKRCCSLFF